MIKLIISISFLIFGVSCSSISEEKTIPHKSTQIGTKAIQYIATGDHYRKKGDYQAALEYYENAAGLFYLKWSKKEFLLSKVKKLLMAMELKKISLVRKEYKTLEKFNRLENLNLQNELGILRIKLNIYDKKYSMAQKEIQKLIDLYHKSQPLKAAYYQGLYLQSLPESFATQGQREMRYKTLESTFNEYLNNEKQIYKNFEISLFLTKALSSYYIEEKKSLSQAKKYLDIYEKMIRDNELLGHMPDLLALKAMYFKVDGNTEKNKFYQSQLKQYKKYKRQL